MILQFIRNLLFPYVSMRFYWIYLKLWQEIVVYKSFAQSLLIKLTIAISACQAASHFYLYLTQPSEHIRLVNFDAIYLIAPMRDINFMFGLCLLMSGPMYYLFYLKGDPYNNTIFYGIMFTHNSYYFLWRRLSTGESVRSCLRKLGVKILKIFRPFFIITCKPK